MVTDHKPLVSIFANSRKGSIRTDRIKLRHQDISFQVVGKKGKKNQADYLSRHATPLLKTPKEWQEESGELEKTVWSLQFSPYTEAISMERIIEKTGKDPILKKLMMALKKGGVPKDDEDLRPYRTIEDELTVSDSGLLLKKDKIILPRGMRGLAIKKAHQGGHPGESRLKQRLRAHFWFPDMDRSIKDFIKGCTACHLFTGKTTKEPIATIEGPDEAWTEVNIDLFGPMPNRQHVLVVQDAFSRFPAASMVESTAAAPVLTALKGVYGSYGNPATHRTDNGPPFNSRKFAEFSQQRGIRHKKVYEYHPQANPAETLMKPLGKALKIAHHDHVPPEAALNEFVQAYRDTPHTGTGETPGNMMFRHGYRTSLPKTSPISDGKVDEVRRKDKMTKRSRADAINASSRRSASLFKAGDKVVITKKDRQRKFEPKFEPKQYVVISEEERGVTVAQRGKKPKRRHKDDVKRADIGRRKVGEDDQFYWEQTSHRSIDEEDGGEEETPDEDTGTEETNERSGREDEERYGAETDKEEDHDGEEMDGSEEVEDGDMERDEEEHHDGVEMDILTDDAEEHPDSEDEEFTLERIHQRAEGKRTVRPPIRFS